MQPVKQVIIRSIILHVLTGVQIFDVIAEKGELWLAKNQDDESETVGWIWSKHFARLAAD